MSLTLPAATRRARPSARRGRPPIRREGGLSWVVLAEAFAAALGFVALAYQARRLGPASFARVEYASAVACWLLVVVRGGFDVIIYREAARRPRLVRPLTDLLVGLRLISACVGYVIVLAVAALIGPQGGAVVALAGLGLFASCWVTDVGPRASGRLGWVALAQASRAIGAVAAVFSLVSGPGDVARAAVCLVLAEASAALVPLALHTREYGFPRPSLRGRATRVLARRGAVAGLSRFARVTLYGADILALGWWLDGGLGDYAAARRVVYALAAFGLVVPAALGPSIAVAWAAGASQARTKVADVLAGLWSLSLPAAVGLGLTADRWMPALFGVGYRDGGPCLALIAARLPWLLAAGTAQAVLVSCRREDLGLRLVLGQLAVAALTLPLAIAWSGPTGAGWAALGVEASGAIVGWTMLKRLGVAPGWIDQCGRAVVGCLGLFAAVRLTCDAPLLVVVVAGGIGYLMAWRAAARWRGRMARDSIGRGSS